MKEIKKYIYPITMIIIGSMIGAIAFNLFIIPNKLLSGGASGIALIINYMTGIKPGLLIMLINVPIFIMGYKFVDREFIVYSIVGTMGFSIFLDMFAFLQKALVLEDILLACIFGGVFCGIGAGIVFRNRGSQGGADIISVIVKKYKSMNIGTTMLAINIIIVSSSIFVLQDPKKAMYTLVMMYVSSQVMDKVAQGFDSKKAITIISDRYDEVGDAIIKEVGRGVTYLHGEGAYSKVDRNVIYCIASLNQLAKIKKIVTDIDENAFLTITEVSEVKGKGFKTRGI